MIKITQRITASAVWDIEGTEVRLQYRKEYPEPVMRKKIEDYRSALENRAYEQDNIVLCEAFTVFGGIAFVAIGLSCREELLRCFSYYAMQFAREWADGEKRLKSKYIGYEYVFAKILTNEKYIGDALLQKTYTVDVLTKKRVKNNGIVPQYYVENSHEPIIPRDLYMQVQEEMLRRANLYSGVNRKKRVYSSKYALSSIVYCLKCGDIYRRIACNNRGKHSTVWRCVNRVEHGPDCCDAPTMQESELQNAVVKAINMALGGKENMLAAFEENIAMVLALEDETSMENIDAKMEELQQELLKRANARQDYEDLADKIDRLRERKQKVMVDNAEREGMKQRIAEMQQFLAGQMEQMKEYDENLVRRMAEKLTVYEDKFTVEFKSATSVDVGR